MIKMKTGLFNISNNIFTSDNNSDEERYVHVDV